MATKIQGKKKQSEKKFTPKLLLWLRAVVEKPIQVLCWLPEWRTGLSKVLGRPARILTANTEGARGYYYANEFDYDIIDLEAPSNARAVC